MVRTLQRAAYRARGTRLMRGVLITAIIAGLLAPLGAIGVGVWSRDASAAATNCGSHYGATGNFGSISLYNYLTGFGDPACTGSRYRAVEYVAITYPATNISYIGFEPSVGVREWDNGTQVYGGYAGAGNVPGIAAWSGWVTGYNDKPFQADQNVKFSQTGYSDYWQYKAY